MKRVFESEYATVFVYPDKRIVHHQFHKFIYGEAFRNALLAGGDAFVANNCIKWLSDDRGNSALKQEDVEWAQKNWEDKLSKAGWKYWALVLPEKAVGQMSMKKIVDHYTSKGLVVKTFTNTEEALTWLSAQ